MPNHTRLGTIKIQFVKALDAKDREANGEPGS